MKKTLFLLLIMAGMGGISLAQTPLSLSQAIQTALENNYSILISDANLELAKNNNSWGTVQRYPNLTFSLQQTNGLGDDQTGEYTSTGIIPNINTNWLLFGGFSVRINKNKLDLLESLSDNNVTLVIENTIQAVVLSYYQALLEREKLDVVAYILELSRDRYQYTQIRKELGSAVTFDLLQAENAYLSDSANYIAQQSNQRNSMRNLNLLMGQETELQYVLSSDFLLDTPAFQLENLIGRLANQNSVLRNQFINQEILKKNIKLERSKLFPTLALNGGYNYTDRRMDYQELPASNFTSYDYYANFSLNFTLFNGGNIRRSIRNARIQEEIGQVQLHQITHSLKNDLMNTLETYNTGRQLLAVANKSAESAQLNLQISEEKYRAGAINSFNYRDVQLIYLNASLGQLNATFGVISSYTELMRLSGGIISEYE